MEDEIRQNLVYLAKNLTNLTLVLLHLIQDGIISEEEGEEIKAENTPIEKNYKLLSTLQKKNWRQIRDKFLEILCNTSNERCAQEIQETIDRHSLSHKSFSIPTRNLVLHPKIKKWWPEKKQLIFSLLRRKFEEKLLIEELKDRLSKDKDRMLVICESQAASKYSGMGGVGKTLTAKWYARTYEQEFDHILWIDCGEGSLLTSFESLARDLDVPSRSELVKVQDYSRKCFDTLSAFKCLWIYDNAENYKGVEEGIINVLPKDEENFYCIITSRSREWGTEKSGFGKISVLELDIFSEEESVEFLTSTLLESVGRTDAQLNDLSRSLGNLPLALQLAVASLNGGKIDLKCYIEKNKLEKIIDERFDDYERTINKNVEIALELLMKENCGKVAHEMLFIFGYIRPDDVEIELFMKVLNIEDEEQLKMAIKMLKKYSLVGKTKMQIDDGIKITLSIHRLLQQVIRHNGRETEKETLRKILGCVGFIDYKLIPFTKYADEELRKEFPKVKAELLDQKQLKKFIREERMEESVELARFIRQELKTQTSKFNLAICLEKNEQLEESLDILKELEKEEMKETGKYFADSTEMVMLGLKEELAKDLIGGHLLIIYWKMDNRKDIKKLLGSRRRFQVIYSTESLGTLIRLVHSDVIKSNYSLVKEYDRSTSKLELGGESSKIQLERCSLDLSSFDQLSPEELWLVDVSFNRNGREVEEANLNEFCDLHKINELILGGSNMSIELSDEISMKFLYLEKVKMLNWKEARWNIQRLRLECIPFVEKTEMTIKEMHFKSSSLDTSCLPPTIEKLYLREVKVVCNEPIDLPNLKYLTLQEMSDSSLLSSFRSPNLKHIHFWIKEVNVVQIPKSVTHIKITKHYFPNTKVFGGVKRVDKLNLEDFSFKEVEELLGHFQTDELVVHSDKGFTPREVITLTKKEIKRIAVGRMNWGKEDFSVLSSHVDRKANYYLWEAGRGRGMEEEEFVELIKLY